MADESSVQQRKKRKGKKFKSYTKFTIPDAEKRVGVIFEKLEKNAILVEAMLDGQSKALGEDAIDEIKRKVYDNVIEYLDTEGYPSEARAHFTEANINDLVYAMIAPIISGFRRQTGRESLQLHRERHIISVGREPEAGGVEEFMVMDRVSITDEKFVIVIEAKRSSVGQALKQCLLAMFDMRGNNGSGKIYGFITTGETWRMISFDGTSFQLSNKFEAMFTAMKSGYEKWEKEYSLLVDCMVFALSDGGGIVNTEAKNDQKFSTIRTSVTPHRLLHTLASHRLLHTLASNSGSRPAKTIAATAANLANRNFVPLKAHYRIPPTHTMAAAAIRMLGYFSRAKRSL